MRCLSCGAEMMNHLVQTKDDEISYDLCEECGSLWLDRGELDKMAFQVEGSIEYCSSHHIRDDIDELTRVLVATPTGAQVPLGQLADIRVTTGPPVIRDENGSLTGWVFVYVRDRDIGSYVADAQASVAEEVQLPAGYYLKWTGEYEAMQRIAQRLKVVLPLTLIIIVVLLYLNFGSAVNAGVVLLSVPFAVVGSFWLLHILGYNLRTAVWVGVIALAGVAAETGVVMIVYLDDAYGHAKRQGQMRTSSDLEEAVIEGAVQRVRPKIMTVLSTMMGLMPIMWSVGTGADVMKRIAAPMIGGMVSSTILTLAVIPAIYMMWRGREVRRASETDDR